MSVNKDFLEQFIIKYTLQQDYSTYDPYDIWKTYLGLFVKKKYYTYPYIIGSFAGLLTLFDHYFNNNLRLFYTKQEYPIVRALASMSLLNLYKVRKDAQFLESAKQNVDWLIQHIYKSATGYGWGLGFPWPTGKSIFYERNMPFSTHTPYPLEAIYLLSKWNGLEYNEVYQNILNFYENDLKILFEDNVSMAISYGPMNDRIAINATSYALYVYAIFTQIFPERCEYLKSKLNKFYNFLKHTQGNNGEWLYMANDKNTFIDCFHSCFIIQNLKKTQAFFPLLIEEEIIRNGWEYIKSNFFDSENRLFRRFSKKNKFNLIEFDLYDNAEALNTAILLNDERIINSLMDTIISKFYYKGHLYSAITKTGKRINRDTLRWAVMPLMFAFSNLLSTHVRNTGDN